jgi:hypothetical protein
LQSIGQCHEPAEASVVNVRSTGPPL